MKARTFSTGLCALAFCLSLFGAEDVKIPFECTNDDLQAFGLTCPEDQPCPIFLELSSVSSAGSKLFLAGNIHSADSTLYSVLLRSSDGGASWKDAVERARGEVLDRIQFQNFQVGWVSGQRVEPLPGDPFLLVTKDGGETWRKAFVLPEGSPGIVQKFGFRSETDGQILIDSGKGGEDSPRYRIFETKDSGDSWTKVEASDQPIQHGLAQEEDSLWRLRSEKSGKRVLLEHRATEAWVAAAAFTIQIGECRER